jgi:hypothetical protein
MKDTGMKLEGKRLPEGSGRRWMDNIKMGLTEVD